MGDTFRLVGDAGEALDAAMRLLREHLDADRCIWVEVEPDEDRFTVRGSATGEGVKVMACTANASSFGADAVLAMRGGQSVAVPDANAILPAHAVRFCEGIDVRALIAAPLRRDGRFVVGIGVHMRTVRARSDGPGRGATFTLRLPQAGAARPG